MRILMFSMTLVMSLTSLAAGTLPSAAQVREKILAAGVPKAAFEKLIAFRNANFGRNFYTQVYTCKNRVATDLRTCGEKERTPATKFIQMGNKPHVAIADFSQSSKENRFYLINLQTGEVKKFRVTHGKGSGADLDIPNKFSNVKDSKMTSLGFYLGGETYKGGYGATLRLHGLENTNDQAYNRDIVMHPAWYASEKFITKKNPKTKQPFGRLGVSWGCPALDPKIAPVVIQLLKEGGLILHVAGQ